MKRLRKQQREATRLERVASRMSVEALGRDLSIQVQSMSSATGMFVTGRVDDPLVALDVIKENAEAVLVLAAELERREKGDEGYLPAPSPRVENLHRQYLERQRAVAAAGDQG